jgi:hypothetical protein
LTINFSAKVGIHVIPTNAGDIATDPRSQEKTLSPTRYNASVVVVAVVVNLKVVGFATKAAS